MDTDRNLLFGVLALQADLIDRNQLVEACTAWAARKDVPLAELLIERGWITRADQTDVERLLNRKLNKHGQDVRASLASVLSADVGRSLAAVDDPAIATHATRVSNGVPDSVLIPPVPLRRERYALLHLHATGGIGRVWLARDEHLGRDVALKELRPERAENPQNWARFLQEARVTGQLEHPGIVPVYELTKRPGSQQPFYTMRFVQGRTLSAAAAAFHQHRGAGKVETLELRALLNAFVGVCNTLAYSHARGVVHRDLKGDNILLGEFGEVLVLDWGLAKVLDQTEDVVPQPPVEVSDDPAWQATLQGQVMGTPAYMAPEQASGQADRIDPRTDVYGLGAILYEILTGQPPFAGSSTIELLRKVQMEEPVPPRQIWAGVPLALEAICLRALVKKPEVRYSSARELAQEVQRWLADEPVHAYAEPWTLQARRWLRRHRPVVAAAGALLVTAVVALAISTVLIGQRERAAQDARKQADQQRQQAEQQRDRADRNLRLAREAVNQTAAKMVDNPLLKQANFHHLRRELLQAMVPFYEQFVKQQENDPDLKAERGRAWQSLAYLRNEMGEKEKARSDYEQTRSIFAELAAEFPAVPEYRLELAKSHNSLGILLDTVGKRAEAETACREALKLETHLVHDFPAVPEYRKHLAISHNSLGVLLQERGSLAEAESAYQEALKLYAQLVHDFPAVPEYRQALAVGHNSLGLLMNQGGKRVDAENAYRQALKLEAQLVHDFPAVPMYRQGLAIGQTSLGLLLQEVGKHAEAESAYRDAVKLYGQLVQDFPAVPAYRNHLAGTMLGGALLFRHSKKLDQARRLLEEALPHLRAALTADPGNTVYHQSFRDNRWHLAGIRLELGECAAAAETAGELLQAAVDPANDVYNAACIFARCVSLAERDSRLAVSQRKERAQGYAGRALATLRQAVQNGYKDAAHMRQDTDLDPVRGRPEFQKLLQKLEAELAQ
jgi:serine/threonine-protein kinase